MEDQLFPRTCVEYGLDIYVKNKKVNFVDMYRPANSEFLILTASDFRHQ